MISDERLIGIAESMYECRRSIKRLYRTNWKERLINPKQVIAQKMEADAIDEISAAIRICKTLNDSFDAMVIMAAAVDMVEPE